MMDTVRIEFLIMNVDGSSVIQNWSTAEGSIQNDAQIYLPRANQVHNRYSQGFHKVRVRVVSEQTNRIMDIIQ